MHKVDKFLPCLKNLFKNTDRCVESSWVKCPMGMGVLFEFRKLGQDTLADECILRCGIQQPTTVFLEYNHINMVCIFQRYAEIVMESIFQKKERAVSCMACGQTVSGSLPPRPSSEHP